MGFIVYVDECMQQPYYERWERDEWGCIIARFLHFTWSGIILLLVDCEKLRIYMIISRATIIK